MRGKDQVVPGKQSSRTLSVALLIVFVATLALVRGAWAATKYKTLYTFKGGTDGNGPSGDLIFGPAGILYGTTAGGGIYGDYGTVFQLTPSADGSWKKSVLHSFNRDGKDGYQPFFAGLILDPTGNLYGTTADGGIYGDYGTVFQLTPNADGSWKESVLHSFNRDGKDGYQPSAGLIFDPDGNLYGTTEGGGAYGVGMVFQLTPNADGIWTESVLTSFSQDGKDGVGPSSSLIFDPTGNLYGTTASGGAHLYYGTVFMLIPNRDGSWTESVLHSFIQDGKDGYEPRAGLIFDPAGNLYGTTLRGGDNHARNDVGTAFQLTPNADGNWKERILHTFKADGKDGWYPRTDLIFSPAGNLYGMSGGGGAYGHGVVFKLRPTIKGPWKEIVLHSFKNNPGALPRAGLIFDGHGSLYGTTAGEGPNTWGSVFEISP